MVERLYQLVAILLLIVILFGCSSSAASLSDTTISLENLGETYGTGEFIPYVITVNDSNGNPFSVDEVYLYINMEGMNHPMEGTMEEKEAGRYELSLPLAMEGEWYVIVTVFAGEDEQEERFTVYAEGERVMEYMKGYNHDEHTQK